MTVTGLDPALERVREYFAASLRGEHEAYAAQWVYPACIYSQGRWQTLPNPQACRESNERYMNDARKQGMTGGRILELSVRAEGRGAAWVDGRFSREGAAGRVIAELRAGYLVVKSGDDWRIAVCVVKD